jgi:hypothetical protein
VRRGYVLIATLWLVVAIAGLTLSANVAAHTVIGASRNRVNQRRSYWQALGCWARRRAQLDAELAKNAAGAWRQLGAQEGSEADGCRVQLTPAGTTLDANHASEAATRAVLVEAGVGQPDADSIVRLIRQASVTPFTSSAAIRSRGGALLQRTGAAGLFGIDTGAVDMLRASAPVVAAARAGGRAATTSAVCCPARLARPPTDSMQAPALAAWWITIAASRGDPPVTSVIAARITHLGEHIGIQEIRTW